MKNRWLRSFGDLSPRALRVVELVLVLVVAFLSAGIGSVRVLLTGHGTYAGAHDVDASWRVVYVITHQVVGLALLAYVLHRQGRTLADLGTTVVGRDALRAVGIFLFGALAFVVCYLAIGGWHAAGRAAGTDAEQVVNPLAGLGITVGSVTWVIINPFFEELLVRAYTMTEVLWLTQSGALAVLVSVAIQAFYHLYQGVPAALGHGATFLVFSLYYLRTRRIAPVVLAHLYMDVGALILTATRGSA